MTARVTRPPGAVSTIRGRWQRPVLTWVSRGLLVVAALSALLPGEPGPVLATVAVAAVVAAPLLRVGWLVFRWNQEHVGR